MTLLSLKCSNPKFKTLNFNKDLSIVVGVSLNKEKKDTTNGVGKSLSLNIIHYMLNASMKSEKIKDFLKNYDGVFELNFSHNNKLYTIEKDFRKNIWVLNNETYNNSEYSKKLNYIFNSTIHNEKVSFKQVFNCFARRSGYYSTLEQQGVDINDYKQRIVNLFLLGIDTRLQEKNYESKQRLDDLKKISKNISEYEKRAPKKNIKDIEDEIERLKDNLSKFIIAKNYDKLKALADKLTENLNEIRNRLHKLNGKLILKKKNFDKSENINIDLKEIKIMYDEAQFFFNDKIVKRLDEAQSFHNQLIENRKQRLATEIEELSEKIKTLETEANTLSAQRDNLIKDLNNSGALEERDSLKDRILTLEKEKKDLEIYTSALKKFKTDEAELALQIAAIKKDAIDYLEKSKDYLNSIENKFRDIVKTFYNNDGGTLEITTTKNAKNLFDININIPQDDSFSISLVKTFCYDMLLYKLNPKLLGFLAHDGELFSEMDRRQKATIFRIVLDEIQSNSLQYFINIGDSSFREVLEDQTDILSDNDKRFIQSKTILKISENEDTWLFGEKFS